MHVVRFQKHGIYCCFNSVTLPFYICRHILTMQQPTFDERWSESMVRYPVSRNRESIVASTLWLYLFSYDFWKHWGNRRNSSYWSVSQFILWTLKTFSIFCLYLGGIGIGVATCIYMSMEKAKTLVQPFYWSMSKTVLDILCLLYKTIQI